MNRRTILASTGVSLVTPLVGCLDGPTNADDGSDDEDERTVNNTAETSDETYDQCDLVSIDYEWLPEGIRDEVDTALEAGQYETERLRFVEAVDPDHSFLVVDDTPYDPRVEIDGTTQTLELEQATEIKAAEPRRIRISNADDRDHDVHIELANGGAIVDETVTVQSGDEREIDATDRFGTYELTAEAQTGHEDMDTFEFSVDDSHFDGAVQVTADEIIATQSVADLEPCSWDTRR